MLDAASGWRGSSGVEAAVSVLAERHLAAPARTKVALSDQPAGFLEIREVRFNCRSWAVDNGSTVHFLEGASMAAASTGGTAAQTYSAYEPEIAYSMALFAEISYEPPNIVEQTVRDRWGFAECRLLEVDETECLIAARDDMVIVSFRGTEPGEWEDWVKDLDLDLVAGPLDGRVHEGFYDALSSVWVILDREVGRLTASQPRRLFVTGHSLGAAVATLSVARWLEARRPVEALYTFGQPRTGDREFSRNFDFLFKPHAFRIVNNKDLVTRVPPRSFGYRHVGTFKYFTDQHELVDDITWWHNFLETWKGGVESLLARGRGGFQDHRMSEYRRLLGNDWSHRRLPAPGQSPPVQQPAALHAVRRARSAEPEPRVRPRRVA